jgi:hypothetical protein
VPVVPPGDLVIDSDQTIGTGAGFKRRVALRVAALTGAPGSITFSSPIDIVYASVNADCAVDATTCAVNPGGLVAPNEVDIDVRFRSAQPITIELRASDGSVVDSYTSP